MRIKFTLAALVAIALGCEFAQVPTQCDEERVSDCVEMWAGVGPTCPLCNPGDPNHVLIGEREYFESGFWQVQEDLGDLPQGQ